MTAGGGPLSRPALVLGVLALIVHAYADLHYDFFRDELYFIVCGRNPALGYVDQPPVIPLIAGFADWAAPGSLLALRALPTLMAVACIAGAIWLVRLLNGGLFAAWLAGLCVFLAPFDMALGSLLTTDLFTPVAWIGCAGLLVKMLRDGDHRRWIPFGIIVGLTLWTKYLIAFNLVALAVALPFTPLRRGLLTRWPYLAALIALAVVAPNVWWQAEHGFPFLELGANGVKGKNIALSLPGYLSSLVVLFGPTAAIVWIAGLGAVAFAPRWRLYRLFALQFVAFVAIETVLHGKDYYAASLFPMLFALGAVAIEAAVRHAVLRGIVTGAVVLMGIVAAPMSAPVLPVETFIAYEHALGYKAPQMEHRDLSELPQVFADMFGWREMAKMVSDAYWALPEADRGKAVFAGNNYGEAAAVDVFGEKLPPSISGHNNYFVWGPRGHDGSVVIRVSGKPEAAKEAYDDVQVVGRLNNRYAMPDEANLYVIVCRGRKSSLIDDWPQFKNYN
ncbi:MAG TPA: glycosyltransferase family 39 protein [Alphaproteobacteria bacterium]|jgi:hypothetical protein|nr:glycosyltransferase family 39 protein [Alphaproteobacteria bacterium]